MKQMVGSLVSDVKKETGKIIHLAEKKKKWEKNFAVKKAADKTQPAKKLSPSKGNQSQTKTEKTRSDKSESPALMNTFCPVCKKGKIIKGRAAYGCSEYKKGCSFRINFKIEGKTLTENQILTLVVNGKTGEINGFSVNSNKVKGHLILDENFVPKLKISENVSIHENIHNNKIPSPVKSTTLKCRKCGHGHMIRGNAAYGCSRYKEGCRFIVPFDLLRMKYNTEELSEDILDRITRS